MSRKQVKRIRALGKILFLLYLLFLLYFLIFSDWYGRTGILKEYSYNLVLFKEIKRFILYLSLIHIYLSRRETAKMKETKRQQLDLKTLKRLMSYLKEYKKRFIFVLICIALNAGAMVVASLFLQVLIDEYIMPLLSSADPEFSSLFRCLLYTSRCV